MEIINKFYNMGFRYEAEIINVKSNIYKKQTIFYHDLDIYNSLLHTRVDLDSNFIKIVNEYVENYF